MQYICDEAQEKLGETWATSDWTVCAPRDIPKQLNGCDCGVFMVKFADWLVRQPGRRGFPSIRHWHLTRVAQSRDKELAFSQADMPYFRRRMVAEIMQKLAK